MVSFFLSFTKLCINLSGERNSSEGSRPAALLILHCITLTDLQMLSLMLEELSFFAKTVSVM